MSYNKKGNVEVIFLSVIFTILIVILMSLYFLYMQINAQIYPIKQDLFYIVQNSYLSMNIEELAYNNYIIDEEILKNKIQSLISKNHKNVAIETLKYDKFINKVKISTKITIEPIILRKNIGNMTITIHDEIKIKTMDVNGK